MMYAILSCTVNLCKTFDTIDAHVLYATKELVLLAVVEG